MSLSAALLFAPLLFTLGQTRVVERQLASAVSASIASSSTSHPIAPTTLTVSGLTEVIFTTTDYQGSTIIVTQRFTTDNSHQPVTEYVPATRTISNSVGPVTQIEVPILDENNDLVVATGTLTTDSNGKTSTYFAPVIISHGLSSRYTDYVHTKSNAADGLDLVLAEQSATLSNVIIPTTRTGSSTNSQTQIMGLNSGSSVNPPTTVTGPTGAKTHNTGTSSFFTESTGSKVSKALKTLPTPGTSQAPTGTGASGTQRPTALSTSSLAVGITPPTITKGPALTSSQISTSLGYGNYPDTITFRSQSDGKDVIGLAFITTGTDGKEFVTNTLPPQSSISGGIALVEGTATILVNPSTIPLATPLPTPSGLQVISGTAGLVTYHPVTLTQYANIQEPFELSTVFTEVINGQTTSQAGVWLIGAGGVIEVPTNKPWGDDDNIIGGIHVIDDPFYTNMPAGTVIIGGGFSIHIDIPGLPKISGPPSFPKSPIDPKNPGPGPGPDPEDDPPPPYPDETEAEEEEEEKEEEKSSEQQSEEQKTTEQESKQSEEPSSQVQATASVPASTFASTTDASALSSASSTLPLASSSLSSSLTSSSPSSVSSSSTGAGCGMIGCYIVAATNYDSIAVQSMLQSWDPEHAQATPLIPSNAAAGGMWFSRKLDVLQSASIASRQDILDIGVPTPNSIFSKVLPDTTTASLDPSLSLVSDDPNAVVPTTVVQKRDETHEMRWESRASASEGARLESVSSKRSANSSNALQLYRRDPGDRLIRSYFAQPDLAVLSWAPGHDAYPNDDPYEPNEAMYVFEEAKGEGTWVYIVDSGCDPNNQEFKNNWVNDPQKTNIDPDWIYDSNIFLKVKKDYQWHGTSVASKITGRIHGVSRQALIIPVVCEETDASSLAALFAVLRDIPIRRARGEALPGKTVMVITWAIETERLWSSYKYVFERIMQSGIILVASAGNYGALDPAKQKGAGPKLMLPPQMWASDDFPIIRVGGTDLEGNVRPWSQEADVHTVGEPAFGARPGTTGDHDADGTCGASSSMAGLILYELSRSNCRYNLGDDITQYSKIVRDYYLTGPGAWQRPHGDVRVAWNHIDGSRDTTCPLEIFKRDGQATDTAAACARPTTTSSIAKSIIASSGDPSSKSAVNTRRTSASTSGSTAWSVTADGTRSVAGPGGGFPGRTTQLAATSTDTALSTLSSTYRPSSRTYSTTSLSSMGSVNSHQSTIEAVSDPISRSQAQSTISTQSSKLQTVLWTTIKTSSSASITSAAPATLLACNGPDNAAFADAGPVIDAISEFCENDDNRNANNPNQDSSYTYGTDSSGKPNTLDYFSLHILYIDKFVARLTVDQCKVGFNNTVEKCNSVDGHGNEKYGGRLTYVAQAELDFTPLMARQEYAGENSAVLQCGTSNTLHYASPTTLATGIQSFCSQATQELPTWGPYHVAGTVYNARSDTYPNGNVYNQGTPEAFVLSIKWRGTAYQWYEDECNRYLTKITTGCQIFPGNDIFVYGGTFTVNYVDYTIEPQWTRQKATAKRVAVCGEWGTWWGGVKYEVHGAGWETSDWGQEGGGMLDWTNHYGASSWNFDYTGDGNTDPENMEWVAYGYNALTLNFIWSAVSQAGGPTDCRVGNGNWPWPATSLSVKRDVPIDGLVQVNETGSGDSTENTVPETGGKYRET